MVTKHAKSEKLPLIGFVANFCAIFALIFTVGLLWVANIYENSVAGLASVSLTAGAKCSCQNAKNSCAFSVPAVLFPVSAENPQEIPAKISMDDSGYREKQLDMTFSSSKTLEIANNGVSPHSFVIDELFVDSGLIAPGQTKKVLLNNIPPVSANYEFYSNVAGDAKEKFSGTLIFRHSEANSMEAGND